jgi:acetolactate synthase-1/2/3 large subunit
VILAAGYGYFTFGSPLPALWTASHNEAPFLSVIFMNRSLTTGTTSLAGQYPDAAAVSAGDFTGGVFDPAPYPIRLPNHSVGISWPRPCSLASR